MSDLIRDAYDPENRDVLLRLKTGGDTLTQARDVHFSVIFPDEGSVLKFSEQMKQLGYEVSFEYNERLDPLFWDATVPVSLVPSEETIGEFELLLRISAEKLGGKNDG